MPHVAGHEQYGATPVDDGTEDPQTFTYDLFSLNRNSIADELQGRKLQDVFGISRAEGGIPSFDWVNTIKSGERTYTDTSAADREKMQQYIDDYKNATASQKSGMPSPAELLKEVGSVLAPVAGEIGASIATGGTITEGLPFTASGSTGFNPIESGTTMFTEGALKDLSGANLAKLSDSNLMSPSGQIPTKDAVNLLGTPDQISGFTETGDSSFLSETGAVVGRDLTAKASFGDLLNPRTAAGVQNYKSAFGGAAGNFVVQLALGQDPVKAAKSAGAGAIGKVFGTAIGGPIGGFIGGAIGSLIGGRVICNELMRQGLLTRKQVVLDYRFTRDHLSPTHVNGYHVWAVWMVKQMRKGKLVKFWKHVAGHRANEIAYIYGERDKPDYLGKVYRKILEPTCWVVGAFCKATDWSVLYKQKEI